MKTYSNATKTTSAIIAIIISYFLVIIRFQFLTPILGDVFYNLLWPFMEFGSALLCIIVPILLAWHKFRFEYLDLSLGFPIIFLLVLIYSPDGWYFIIPKIGTPSSNNFVYGLAISIMFFFLQFSVLALAKGLEKQKRTKKLNR